MVGMISTADAARREPVGGQASMRSRRPRRSSSRGSSWASRLRP